MSRVQKRTGVKPKRNSIESTIENIGAFDLKDYVSESEYSLFQSTKAYNCDINI